jgi:hypothetical protein
MFQRELLSPFLTPHFLIFPITSLLYLYKDPFPYNQVHISEVILIPCFHLSHHLQLQLNSKTCWLHIHIILNLSISYPLYCYHPQKVSIFFSLAMKLSQNDLLTVTFMLHYAIIFMVAWVFFLKKNGTNYLLMSFNEHISNFLKLNLW